MRYIKSGVSAQYYVFCANRTTLELYKKSADIPMIRPSLS